MDALFLFAVASLVVAVPVGALFVMLTLWVGVRFFPLIQSWRGIEPEEIYRHPETGLPCSFDDAVKAEMDMFSGWVKANNLSNAVTRRFN